MLCAAAHAATSHFSMAYGSLYLTGSHKAHEVHVLVDEGVLEEKELSSPYSNPWGDRASACVQNCTRWLSARLHVSLLH
jgi:hypothetical protein